MAKMPIQKMVTRVENDFSKMVFEGQDNDFRDLETCPRIPTNKLSEGKMNKIKIMGMLVLFLGTAVGNLFAQYLDVGENPERVVIKNITSIIVPIYKYESYRQFAGWSPDGEDFAFKLNDKKKTLLFRKNGEFFKEIDGLISLWLLDSQRIIVKDIKGNYFITNIINSGKVSIGINYSIVEICNNPMNGNIIFQDSQYNIVELDVNSLEVKIISNKNKEYFRHIQLLSNICLFYSKSGSVFKFDLNTNLKNNISKGNIKKYFMLRDKNYLVIVSQGLSFSILNEDGKEILKQNILFKRGDPGLTSTIDDIYRINHIALAPNGKLLAITRGLFDSEGYRPTSSADIWLINMNGKTVKLTDTQNMVEYVQGWSPQGDKIIFLDARSSKFYLMEIKVGSAVPVKNQGK